ncbi:MAG: sigma-70 family RNA polymerase sigma factor [Saprospiraceae bacterium]|nr:sigma-70 family RNA polymerase sigma factor [Saprospiraceae bacterium]
MNASLNLTTSISTLLLENSKKWNNSPKSVQLFITFVALRSDNFDLEIAKHIIDGCKRSDQQACKALYLAYKDKMYGLCLRYAESVQDADDIFQEGFIKVFRDIVAFRGEGSFEGWMRRLFVNTSLHFLKQKRKSGMVFEDDFSSFDAADEIDESIELSENRQKLLIELMQKLPDGYRTVLNLYVMEDFSHEEISKQLGISLSTSKTQLMRAKIMMKKLLENALIKN